MIKALRLHLMRKNLHHLTARNAKPLCAAVGEQRFWNTAMPAGRNLRKLIGKSRCDTLGRILLPTRGGGNRICCDESDAIHFLCETVRIPFKNLHGK